MARDNWPEPPLSCFEATLISIWKSFERKSGDIPLNNVNVIIVDDVVGGANFERH